MRRKFKKGKIRNATKVVQDGITFRSKLELYTYNKLKEHNIKFEYESTKFVLIDKFTYPKDSYESYKSKGGKKFDKRSNSIRPMSYLPDFINQDDRWIIEVKGFANDAFPLRWKLFKFITKDNPYTLFLPSNAKEVDEVIKILKKIKNE